MYEPPSGFDATSIGLQFIENAASGYGMRSRVSFSSLRHKGGRRVAESPSPIPLPSTSSRSSQTSPPANLQLFEQPAHPPSSSPHSRGPAPSYSSTATTMTRKHSRTKSNPGFFNTLSPNFPSSPTGLESLSSEPSPRQGMIQHYLPAPSQTPPLQTSPSPAIIAASHATASSSTSPTNSNWREIVQVNDMDVESERRVGGSKEKRVSPSRSLANKASGGGGHASEKSGRGRYNNFDGGGVSSISGNNSQVFGVARAASSGHQDDFESFHRRRHTQIVEIGIGVAQATPSTASGAARGQFSALRGILKSSHVRDDSHSGASSADGRHARDSASTSHRSSRLGSQSIASQGGTSWQSNHLSASTSGVPRARSNPVTAGSNVRSSGESQAGMRLLGTSPVFASSPLSVAMPEETLLWGGEENKSARKEKVDKYRESETGGEKITPSRRKEAEEAKGIEGLRGRVSHLHAVTQSSDNLRSLAQRSEKSRVAALLDERVAKHSSLENVFANANRRPKEIRTSSSHIAERSLYSVSPQGKLVERASPSSLNISPQYVEQEEQHSSRTSEADTSRDAELWETVSDISNERGITDERERDNERYRSLSPSADTRFQVKGYLSQYRPYLSRNMEERLVFMCTTLLPYRLLGVR